MLLFFFTATNYFDRQWLLGGKTHCTEFNLILKCKYMLSVSVCVCGVNIFKCTAVVNPSKMEDMEKND
jgi:hypothetical protein